MLIDQLRQQRILAILRQRTYGDVAETVDALVRGGIGAVEFTYTGDNAAAAIALTKTTFPDVLVGAGTVLNRSQLESALAAGADFAVSPAFDADLVAAAAGRLPFIPGVLTPSEVATAARAGCTLLKLFPASLGGPSYTRELGTLFPTVRFLPTGGISLETAPRYLDAGAVAVGLGAALVGSFGIALSAESLEARARQVVELTSNACGGTPPALATDTKDMKCV